ncbi:homoserine O-acetyltransferase [candidate division KSB1 bacterium]|nr:homoserine O-acetyltransferase [candidate division KSB1 bacterium]RQW08949.1 MAG: homoserine O-acetyltransferase [candidate division KSB1 bacterium]
MNENSVGLVRRQYFTFAEPPNEMPLESGEKLGPITLAYETYGSLNREKNNAILIAHALSGDSHAAGYYSADERKRGWWDFMIGPGRSIDTNKYFVICSNALAGCQGSTGPSSLNPTGKRYNLSFPVITIGDMVRAQTHLIDALGIKRLLSVIGGSMGGMQALEWAVEFPDRIASCVPHATTTRLNAQGIAFDEVGRQAIFADPDWRNGNYLDEGVIPEKGLAVARMLAHITYLSEESMHQKFGRRLREKERYGYDFSLDFEVESYLRHQGSSFVQRFDANTYLYITKAIDYFDLKQNYGSLEEAFRHVTAKVLVFSFTSDWLFPTSQNREIVQALQVHRKPVSFVELDSPYGHDSFLIPNAKQEKLVSDFLRTVYDDQMNK